MALFKNGKEISPNVNECVLKLAFGKDEDVLPRTNIFEKALSSVEMPLRMLFGIFVGSTEKGV